VSRWREPHDPPEPSRDDVIAATEPSRAEVEAELIAAFRGPRKCAGAEIVYMSALSDETA
jgi:hypothetical protein